MFQHIAGAAPTSSVLNLSINYLYGRISTECNFFRLILVVTIFAEFTIFVFDHRFQIWRTLGQRVVLVEFLAIWWLLVMDAIGVGQVADTVPSLELMSVTGMMTSGQLSQSAEEAIWQRIVDLYGIHVSMGHGISFRALRPP